MSTTMVAQQRSDRTHDGSEQNVPRNNEVKRLLDVAFGDREERLHLRSKELSRFSAGDEAATRAQFEGLVDSAIEVTLLEARQDAKRRCDALKERLEQAKARLQTLRSRLDQLVEERADLSAEAHDVRKPTLYFALYVLMTVVMLATAALTAEMLFEEQGRLLAWLTSAVFIGGSFAIGSLYKHSDCRTRFSRRVNWLCFIFIVMSVLSFAFGRGLIFLELRQGTTSANLFAASQTSSWIPVAQSINAIIGFLLLAASEMFFASSLFITAYARHEPKITGEALDKSAGEIQESIRSEEDVIENTTSSIEQLENLDAFQKAWANEKKTSLLHVFDVEYAGVREEALGIITSLPNPVMRTLSSLGQRLTDRSDATKQKDRQ